MRAMSYRTYNKILFNFHNVFFFHFQENQFLSGMSQLHFPQYYLSSAVLSIVLLCLSYYSLSCFLFIFCPEELKESKKRRKPTNQPTKANRKQASRLAFFATYFYITHSPRNTLLEIGKGGQKKTHHLLLPWKPKLEGSRAVLTSLRRVVHTPSIRSCVIQLVFFLLPAFFFFSNFIFFFYVSGLGENLEVMGEIDEGDQKKRGRERRSMKSSFNV